MLYLFYNMYGAFTTFVLERARTFACSAKLLLASLLRSKSAQEGEQEQEAITFATLTFATQTCVRATSESQHFARLEPALD